MVISKKYDKIEVLYGNRSVNEIHKYIVDTIKIIKL